MKRRFLAIGTLLIIGVVAGYLAVGVVIYSRLTSIEPNCNGRFQTNTPDDFDTQPYAAVDTTPYLVPDYQEVSFPSRGANPLTVSGWYVPDAEDSPVVIIVHGRNDCKRHPVILLAGGMLHRDGFSVLMIDLRDQGESEIEDGRYSGGTEEYLDALGAWDWLVEKQGVSPERIGLMGFSLGAATVMIAAGEEPQVAAVWEDSGYADITVAIKEELARNGYPTFFVPGTLFVGRLISGDNLVLHSPLEAAQKLEGRAIFITHGASDTRLSADYAYDLAEAVREDGGSVEPWIVPDTEHILAILEHPVAYEQRLVAFFEEALSGS